MRIPVQAFQGACADPIDDRTLELLTLSPSGHSYQARPGETLQLQVYRSNGDGTGEPIGVCVAWSLEGNSIATIDPQTGLFTVSASVGSGWHVTVAANVERGRRVLTVPVFVYTDEAAPVVGVWHEIRRLSCAGKRVRDGDSIVRLEYRADGTMSVRFENGTIDYDGRYLFDLATGKLAMEWYPQYATGKFDGFGRFRIDSNGHLIVMQASFGKSWDGDHAGCRYVFERLQ
jgi:hypothetical protein